MGWSIGYDSFWNRYIGYSVPCRCDHPYCHRIIDRGLSYVCGGEPYGGEQGCGLYFCAKHLIVSSKCSQLCQRCYRNQKSYKPKPELKKWINWQMRHISWKKWRKENGFKEPRKYITEY